MADGRQRAEWQRVSSLAARIHLTMTGEAIDPDDLIPDRYRLKAPERPKTPEEEEHEGRCAWRLLDTAFNPTGK